MYQKKSIEEQKKDWLAWFKSYGAKKFLDSFLRNVEGAKSECEFCGEDIYVDVLIGGGVPDWSTEDGDFGCSYSPETNEEGTGGHSPVGRQYTVNKFKKSK